MNTSTSNFRTTFQNIRKLRSVLINNLLVCHTARSQANWFAMLFKIANGFGPLQLQASSKISENNRGCD